MTDYTVIRSRRRTMALEVTREGAALVRAPTPHRTRPSPASRRSTRRGWKATWPAVRRIWRPTPSHRPSRWRHGGSRRRRCCRSGWPIGPTHGRTARGHHHHRRPHAVRQLLRQEPAQLLTVPDAYPAAAIEYVVVHELAHIRHHDHSPAFYAEVERYLPDWRARRELLKN